MAYTSNDEFNAERRVQLTNEIRPLDIYEGVNSTLKNDIWQWLLGWTEVTTDVEYDARKEDPNNTAYYDKDYNAYSSDYPSKIVNGVVSKNYSEKTKEVWNPIEQKYVEVGKKGLQHLEIDGALLPEHDLFLHEIYRYLSCLYPDHPDWIELLTHNEIVDAFENAAEMVNYMPDDRFFQLVAENMERLPKTTRDGKSFKDEVAIEEFKLLLRNLTNNAVRRKFYGANDGLKMFASAIGEVSSCFPVGEYLPIVPKTVAEDQDTPYDSKELTIDIFDPNYRKPFRIIDWTGKSRDIPLEDELLDDVIAFTTPGKEKFLVEAHDPSDPLPEATSAKGVFDFKTLFKIPSLKNNISYLQEIDAEKSKTVSTIHPVEDPSSKEEKLSHYSSDTSVSNKRVLYKILQDFPVRYASCYAYKALKDLDFTTYEKSIGESLSKSYNTAWNFGRIEESKIYKSYYVNHLTSGFYRGLLGNVYSLDENYNQPNELKYTWNDSVNGIMLTPREMLKLYPTKTTYVGTEKIVRVKDKAEFTKDFPLSQETVLSTDIITSLDSFELAQPVGVNKGIIDIDCKSVIDEVKFPPKYFGEWNSRINSGLDFKSSEFTYGIVIKNNYDQYIAVEGSMRILWRSQGTSVKLTEPSKVKFYIESIPQEKSESLCKLIYEDWEVIDENEKALRRKNRELICEDRPYILHDDRIETYETITFGHDNEIKTFYMNLPKVEGKDTNEVSLPIEFIQNTGTITDLSLGYISLIRYLNVDGLQSVEFSFNTLSQQGISELPSEESLKKYYDYKLLDAVIYDVNLNPVPQKIPYLMPKTDFIKNAEESEEEKNKEDIYSLTPNRLWVNFVNQAATDKGEVLITALRNILNRVDIEAYREDFVTDENKDFLYTLIFSGEENLRKFETLSVGDIVEANGLERNTFIVEKGTNSIKLNHQIPKAGTYEYKFWVSVEAYPTDITEDFRNYKFLLKENKSLETINPWNNGLYGSDDWPHVSNSFVNGLVDPQDFMPWNVSHISFKNVMKAIYQDKIKDDTLLIPSTVTLGDLLYYELNANKLIQLPNREGHIGNIMNVEWLDYLDNNLNTITQASEKTNVGVNLMMQTDTSQTYSQRKDAKYTDDDLKLKFQAIADYVPGVTVPTYIQIGTDGSNYEKYFKLPKDVIKPNVYGAALFDHPMPGLSKEVLDKNRKGDYLKRHIYSKGDKGIVDLPPTLYEVDSPLFEIPLGEYDVQQGFTPTTFENDPKEILKADTVSASFGKQTYTGLTRPLPVGTLKASSEKILSTQLFDDERLIFEGVYVPGVDSKNQDFDFPIPEKNWETDKIHYYTIMENLSFEFDLMGKKSHKTIKAGDFILYKYENSEWNHYVCRSYYNGIIFDRELADQGYNTFFQRFKNAEGKYEYKTDLLNFVDFSKTSNFYTDQAPLPLKGVDQRTRSLVYRASIFPNLSDKSSEEDISEAEFTKIISDVKDIINNVERDKTEGQMVYLLPFTAIASKEVNKVKTSLHYYILDYNKTTNTFDSYKVMPGLFASSISFKDGLQQTVPVEGSEEPKLISTNASEFAIFSGKPLENLFIGNAFNHSVCKKTEIISDLSIIDNENSVVQLPRTFITNGSYDIRFRADPKFISSGYLYGEDGKPIEVEGSEVNFNISQNKIFYDDINRCFYTNADLYSETSDEKTNVKKYKIGEKNKKVKLKFEEQKFFKNKYIFSAKYKKSNSLKEKSSTPDTLQLLYSLDNSPIICNYLSTSDKILGVKEVFLRSDYNTYLEPSLVSNYTPVDGEIYGLSVDKKNEVLGLLVGTVHDETSSFTFDKVAYASKVKTNFEYIVEEGDVSPLSKQKIYNYEEIQKSKVKLTTPLLKTADILIPIGMHTLDRNDPTYTEVTSSSFKYFKNYLVFKGSVSLENSSIITPAPENEDVFMEAVKQMSRGDTIIQAISLASSPIESRKTIGIKAVINGEEEKLISKEIQSAIYEDDTLAFAGSNAGTAYVYWERVPRLESLDKVTLTNKKMLPTSNSSTIQSLKLDLNGNLVVVLNDGTSQKPIAINAFGEDKKAPNYNGEEYEYNDKNPSMIAKDEYIAIFDVNSPDVNLEIDAATGLPKIPSVFMPNSGAEFVNEKDISKTKDGISSEVQSRDVWKKNQNGIDFYYSDEGCTQLVERIPGSTLERKSEGSNCYTEKIKVALYDSLPYSVTEVRNGKANKVVGAWHEASTKNEVLIRGNGHIFIKSPVSQTPFATNALTQGAYWTYGKIPTLVDTLMFTLETSDPNDIAANLIEITDDYKAFFKATDATVAWHEAKEAWDKAEQKKEDESPRDDEGNPTYHKRPYDKPEPEPSTPYKDYTDLQKIHYQIDKMGRFNILDYKKFVSNVNSYIVKDTYKPGPGYEVPLEKRENPENPEEPIYAVSTDIKANYEFKVARDTIGNIDYPKMYVDYAFTWIRTVLGGSPTHLDEFILSGEIKSSIIHNDRIYLLLTNNRVISYELRKAVTQKDINDPLNWKSLRLPAKTTYISNIDQRYIETAQGPIIYYIDENKVLRSDGQKLVSDLRTIFNIEDMYTYQDTIIYYGEYDKISDIENNYTPPIEELENGTPPFADFYGKAAENQNLPAILYTSGTDPEIRELDLFDLFSDDASPKPGIFTNKNITIDSIQAVKGSVYISVKADGELIENKIKISFVDGLICDKNYSNPEMRPHWIDRLGTLLNGAYSSKCQGGEISIYEETGNGAIYDQPGTSDDYTFDYSFNGYATVNDVSVLSKTNKSVTLNKRLLGDNIAAELGETATFLFAMYTDLPVTNQFKYLQIEQDVFENISDLETCVEVAGPSRADMFFNENDAALISDAKNPASYSSVEDDTDKKFFLYDTYSQELLPYTNGQGGRIYRCNRFGDLLSFAGEYKEGRRDDSCFFSIRDGILNLDRLDDTDFEKTFVPAGHPVTIIPSKIKDIIPLEKDDVFYKDWISKGEGKVLDIDLSEISFNASYIPHDDDEEEIFRDGSPYIIYKTDKVIDNTEKFAEKYLLPLVKDVYDTYVKKIKEDEETGKYSADEYLQTILVGKDQPSKDTLEYILSVKNFLETREGPWGSRGNIKYEKWYDRILCKELKGKYYIFDASTKVFTLKVIRYLKGIAGVGYKTNRPAESTPLAGISFEFNELKDGGTGNILQEPEGKKPIQGVAISTLGYGGEKYGKTTIIDWSEKVTPWDMDPHAFVNTQDANDKFIFVDIVNTIGEPVYLYNEFGRVVTDEKGIPIRMKKPAYKNFKDLTSTLGLSIEDRQKSADGSELKAIEKPTLEIKNIDSDNKVITISGDLRYIDGKEVDNTILEFETLTIENIPLPKNLENDERYIHTLTLKELDIYPANRVFFNPRGIPAPTVPLSKIENSAYISIEKEPQVKNGYYRGENQYAFYTVPYKNENSIEIYECDEKGKYIKYVADQETGTISQQLIDVNSVKDEKFNPNKPIFDTCQDWFRESFYNPKDPSNPFWQVIRVFPVFDKNLKKFVSDIKTYGYEKSTLEMKLRELPKQEAYFSLYNTPIKEENKGELYIIPKASYIDLKKGQVRFLMGEPLDKSLKNKKDLVKFGISYANSFYEGEDAKGILSDIWTKDVKLDSIAELNYTINSSEDLSDTSNKDAGIVRITELGIFDQDHKLVLYSTFPPIEYRSDTQHISFTCVVNWKTLFDYTDKSESNPYRNYEVPKCTDKD